MTPELAIALGLLTWIVIACLLGPPVGRWLRGPVDGGGHSEEHGSLPPSVVNPPAAVQRSPFGEIEAYQREADAAFVRAHEAAARAKRRRIEAYGTRAERAAAERELPAA